MLFMSWHATRFYTFMDPIDVRWPNNEENSYFFLGFEKALKDAAEDGEDVAENLKRYGLRNQQERFEVAKVAAKQYGEGTSEYIANFDLAPEQRFEIAKIAAMCADGIIASEVHNYEIDDPKKLFILAKLSMKHATKWDDNFFAYFQVHDKGKIFQLMFIAKQFNVDLFDEARKELSGDKEQKLSEVVPSYNFLNVKSTKARNSLVNLIAWHFDESLLKKSPLEVVEKTIGVTFNANSKIKKEKLLVQQFIVTAEQGANQKLLDLATSGKSSTKSIKYLQKISAIIALGFSERLDAIESLGELDMMLKNCFSEACNLKDSKGFIEKYDKNIDRLRDPNALAILYSSLLGYDGALKDFSTLFYEILEDTFLENRRGMIENEGWNSGESKLVSIDGKRLLLIDSDDPSDLILLGTEVHGSCLIVSGNPEDLQGLLGIILNGYNRVLAIKEPESGEILGRAILRIMDADGKPALFLERIYPAKLDEAKSAALIDFAKQRASNLGLPLYNKDTRGEVTDVVLNSYSGRAHCEYVDGTMGVEYGRFSITDAELM